MTRDLDETLQYLAEQVVRPREEDGTPATLVALLPCEPAVGEVAVACWADSDGGELVELLRLADGTRIEDAVALREALSLLAMVETMEELASFEVLPGLAKQLAEWTGDGAGLSPEYVTARDAALRALDALAAQSPGDAARIARPQLLDQMAAALRQLEQAWELLEQAAELWSDAYLSNHPDDSDAIELVQSLWRILGIARRGPLLKPASSALQAGREAGVAMASAVADARAEG